MSTLVEFAMFPTDKGESVSAYVGRIIAMFEASQIAYELTPMGTIFECETIGEANEIIAKAYATLEPDCRRVYTTIKMDIRQGKKDRMRQKIASVQRYLSQA